MKARFAVTEFHHVRRKWASAAVSAFTLLCALLVISPLVLILLHLIRLGGSSLNTAFFTRLPAPSGESGGGMANAIAGTFILLGLATLVSVPIGILGGIYIAEYGAPRGNWLLRFLGDVLNGVPSIIWGVVVWSLIVFPMHSFSALAGGIALACIMIPLVMRTSEEALCLVPGSYREAAIALGVPRWRVTLQIVARTALRGIVTGVLLTLARVAGETAPLLFTALNNQFWNHSLRDPIASLPVQIFNFAISAYEDEHRQAWAGALVLLMFVFLVNISVRLLTRRPVPEG